jgi:hypothetical protein
VANVCAKRQPSPSSLPEKTMSRIRLIQLLIWFALCITAEAQLKSRPPQFPPVPSSQYTLLSLPFDWKKTIIHGDGTLAYDYGPGGYSVPGTMVSIGMKGIASSVTAQYFEDPRIPIANTELLAGGTRIHLRSMTLIPEPGPDDPARPFVVGRVKRLQSAVGSVGWAQPRRQADPAFRDVAWGTNRPILYRVRIEPGGRRKVALGICDAKSYGTRTLSFQVEGAEPVLFNTDLSWPVNEPASFTFDAHDTDGDGELAIEVHGWKLARDPNVILNVLWVFPAGSVIDSVALIRGALSGQAEVYYDCGTELEQRAQAPRMDGIIAEFDGDTRNPVVSVNTRRVCVFDSTRGALLYDGHPFILTNPRTVRATLTGSTWDLELPSGTRKADVVVVHGGRNLEGMKFAPDLGREQQKVEKYWKTRADIPDGKITVPDSLVQAVMDVNIRNIYQCADINDGYPVFGPGPTVYRGIWLYDILFAGEPLLLLGDIDRVTRYFDLAFTFQELDGRFHQMRPHDQIGETGLALVAMSRYAEITGDTAWLRRNFDRMRESVRWLQTARAMTLTDSVQANDGLLPSGFVDGGIAGSTSDYGSVLISLCGLERAIGAAELLGFREEKVRWERIFSEFFGSFLRAAKRDARHDRFGNLYIPVAVGDTSTLTPPQRGQWGFTTFMRLGKFFHGYDAFLDSLVDGNLAMLEGAMQEGLVVDVGWLSGAVWSWYSAMQSLTYVWRQDFRRAHAMLDALLAHAATLGTWVEEQQVRTVGTRTAGDAADAEASAFYINLIRHLLLYERGDTLEVFEGVPDEWFTYLRPLELRALPTTFGDMTLRLTFSPDGGSGTLVIAPIDGHGKKGSARLHLGALRRLGFRLEDGRQLSDQYVVEWGDPITMRFRR